MWKAPSSMKKLLLFVFVFASFQVIAQQSSNSSNSIHNSNDQKRHHGLFFLGSIYNNAIIVTNRHYQSANRKYFFTFQPDGNMVIYRSLDHKNIWSSGTTGRSVNKCEFQKDGNLVLTSAYGTVVWDAFAHQNQQTNAVVENTADNRTRASRNALIMQNDGNLVIYKGISRNVKWASYSNQ